MTETKTINEKVLAAKKMLTGKPDDERAYYEGMEVALEWVLSNKDYLRGYYGERL